MGGASARSGRALALALVLSALGAGGRASADDPRATAARAYDKGSDTFAHHEYGAAADWFELADRLAPDPLALEGAVKAHRKIGSPANLARAATLALRLRARASSDGEVRFADEALAALAPIFGRLTVRCGSCELAVDGAAIDARDFFLVPGDHRLTARWPDPSAPGRGREDARTVHAVGGAKEALEWAPPRAEPAPPAPVQPPPVVEPPPAPPPAASPPPAHGLSPAYALTGLGLTAGLGAAAAVLWFAEAVPNGNTLTTEAQSTHRADPTLQSRVDGETRAVVVLDVATGVVCAASLVTALFFTRWKDEASSPSVGLAPAFVPLPGGGVASLGARF